MQNLISTTEEIPGLPVSSPFDLVFQTVSRVNFASAQNGIQILKQLTLKNQTQAPLRNLSVQLQCHPAIVQEKNWVVDQLLPGEEVALPHLDTLLDIAMLQGLNEAEQGELILRVCGEGQVLHEERHRIDLLARDQWGGIADMPYLLAAFVWPNDAVVASVLKDASRLLENAGHDGSLDGYQSTDPGRVWMLAGAIWSALTGLGLSYAVPPASFELQGQKIRDPARIRSEGLATCLDTALLLAACFEAAGLNAVVMFSQGHAWTGAWLIDRDFGSVTETDVITVRKAIAAREFIVLETTLLTRRPVVGFEAAFSAAREHTAELNEHAFQMAVDIRRARAARIRPLASHQAPGAEKPVEGQASIADLPKPLDTGRLPGEEINVEPKTSDDRIARWQRKLLDLSLRNRLLNFRDSKQTLPFVCPDVPALEDRLAAGKRFKTLSLDDEDPVGNRDRRAVGGAALLAEVAQAAFEKQQIAVPLGTKEMNARLLELYRRAKGDLQEGGANTLFLAAGFLSWKKSPEDARSYRAPLLLIPVKLSRRSATSEFVIERHEDDVRFNATLLEFLKRDFDLKVPELEGDLPHDESGYDLPRIFNVLRSSVRDVPGFEVLEDLALSTFSFSKFLMWKDLVDRTDSLRESRLVRHLVDNPTESFLASDDSGLPQAQDVDRRLSPKDLFTLLPADSSQLAAVLAAQEGRDFVLIGPPGTGKSQTIANIISQCLAVGKTVLFVAEKSAALDVVHRRLAAHGLGDAVLELHSNKADRKSVLDQLGRSWDRLSLADETEWVKVTDDLAVTGDQLNAYVQALHHPGAQGFSVYQGIGRVGTETPAFKLDFGANPDIHDAQSYAHLYQLAEALGRACQVVGHRPAPELVATSEWSFSWQTELLQVAQALLERSLRLQPLADDLARAFGLTVDPVGAGSRIGALASVCAMAPDGLDVSWGVDQNRATLHQEAQKLLTSLRAFRDALGGSSARYPQDRLTVIPLDRLDAAWRQATIRWWPLSALGRSSVRKLLQTYAVSGVADPGKDIPALMQAVERQSEILSSLLANCPVFAAVDTDESQMTQWLAEVDQVRQALDSLQADVADDETWAHARNSLAGRQGGALQERLDHFAQAYQEWKLAATDFARLSGTPPDQMCLASLIPQLQLIQESRESLADWVHWVGIRDQARAAGLGALVDVLQNGAVQLPATVVFEQAYAAWWLPLAMDAKPCLRTFAQWSHEDLIVRFRALVERASGLAAHQVLRRIHHGLPRRDSAPPRKSELGVLRHQLSLQRPSMPIRTLISEMPDAFTKLAPCVLMSPLSVAHYLPPGQAQFDVVIFDEASQITTWDAIGAIARGRQAIIVGDPKQLPPTNFFGRADEDEDLPEMERDLTSILDEVVAAGIPTRQLNWHYRSRDESLIAFSNWNYYGGHLVTFPSPATKSQAVQLHQVDGVYGRGKGRTNEAEARAIVRMIVQRLQQWLLLPEAKRQTLGVITFNIEQQGLILDLLDEARRQDGRLEWFFEDDREEPVIVKNLENIQGDERDVMLFSITFGADAAGKLSMAFGALNSEGGEKRLNVAVTRARRELHVFSSVRVDQIDLGRTGALGVKHLKEFLDFASRGSVALPAQIDGSLGPVDNGFEEAVLMAIQARGWELRTQIGVSGFRIDLGVVHPDHAGVYLAGIECDGATYHRSASARDRDKIRQAVLEGLGWTILRVWSTDWFKNPLAALSRIHQALLDCLERDRVRRAAVTDASGLVNGDATTGSEGQAPGVPEQGDSSEHALNGQTSPGDETSLAGPLAAEAAGSQGERERLVARSFPVENTSRPVASDSLAAGWMPVAEEFFQPDYDTALQALIAREVQDVGPLPVSALCRRIAMLHGWQRTGRRIVERVNASLCAVEAHDEDGVTFLWSPGTHGCRIPFRSDRQRDIRDVSRTEIAALYDEHALHLDVSPDPVRDLARFAGVTRLSADARDYLNRCLIWRLSSA